MSTVKNDVSKDKKAQTFASVMNLAKVNQEQEKAVPAQVEKFAEIKKPTAEERILRITHFEAVSKRFGHLKEKSNGLKMFDAGNDRTNAKIILRNSEGYEFEVSNSNVIQKVRDAMEKELQILLTEAENEILNFEI